MTPIVIIEPWAPLVPPTGVASLIAVNVSLIRVASPVWAFHLGIAYGKSDVLPPIQAHIGL
jgi:hypothetical protein